MSLYKNYDINSMNNNNKIIIIFLHYNLVNGGEREFVKLKTT